MHVGRKYITLTMTVAMLVSSFLFSPYITKTYATESSTLDKEHATPKGYGMHVPWALPGKRIMETNAAPIEWEGEWPTVPFNTIRLWDTRTAWSQIQPRSDIWYWNVLDAHLEKSNENNVSDIIFVISGTPEWAATTPAPESASWIGENSASPPNLEAWKTFIEKLVKRYKGKITAYEIWNEPNVSLFWQGNNEELFELISVASQIIKEKDPQAKIIAPAPLIRNVSGAKETALFWEEMKKREWLGVDVLATHVYPTFFHSPKPRLSLRNTQSKLDSIMKEIETQQKNLDWEGEHWVTELSFVSIAQVPPKLAEKLAYYATHNILQKFTRVYWYAWGRKDAHYHSAMIFDEHSGASKGFSSVQQKT